MSSAANLNIVLAAMIAGGISVVVTTLGKEQKVSEFRQAWIDELRNDLASFLASARAFARAEQAKQAGGNAPFGDEKLSNLRLAAAENLYRIKFRLNPEESIHQKLLQSLTDAVASQNAAIENKQPPPPEVFAHIDAAAEAVPALLKLEWKRVKKGEVAYRVVRGISMAIVACATAAFFGMLYLEFP